MLSDFLKQKKTGIDWDKEGLVLSGEIGKFFTNIPYENLTKILDHTGSEPWSKKLRTPDRVFQGFFSDGTGGTCFTLTWALVSLLREARVPSYPVLADRKNGADKHCAVVMPHNNGDYFLDPGYLITSPVLLPVKGCVVIKTPVNDIKLERLPGTPCFDVSTIDYRGEKWRYRIKNRECSFREFSLPWMETFTGSMVNTLLLTRINRDSQVYFHGHTLECIYRDKRLRDKIPDNEVPRVIKKHFGIRENKIYETLSRLS